MLAHRGRGDAARGRRGEENVTAGRALHEFHDLHAEFTGGDQQCHIRYILFHGAIAIEKI
jgi:hypothetical protein